MRGSQSKSIARGSNCKIGLAEECRLNPRRGKLLSSKASSISIPSLPESIAVLDTPDLMESAIDKADTAFEPYLTT